MCNFFWLLPKHPHNNQIWTISQQHKNKSCQWHLYYQQGRVWLDICNSWWKVHISFPLLRSITPTNYFGSQFCQSIPHRHLVGSRWQYVPDKTYKPSEQTIPSSTIHALVFCTESMSSQQVPAATHLGLGVGQVTRIKTQLMPITSGLVTPLRPTSKGSITSRTKITPNK